MSVSEDSSTSEFEEFARTRLTGEPSFTAARVPELNLNSPSQAPSASASSSSFFSSQSSASPLSFSSPTPTTISTPPQQHHALSSSVSSGHISTTSSSSPSLSSTSSSSSPFSASTPSFSALTSSTSASSFQPTRRGSSWIGGQQQQMQKSTQPLVSPRTPSSGSSWFTPIMALLSPRWLEEDTEADTKAAVASVSPRSDSASPRVTPRLPEAGETFTYFEGVSWVAKVGSADGIPIRLAIGENVSIFSPTGELMFAFQLRKIRQYGTKLRTFLVEHHQDNDEMRWIYLLTTSEAEANTMKATLRHAIQSAAKQMSTQ